jgi:hypothetical protein
VTMPPLTLFQKSVGTQNGLIVKFFNNRPWIRCDQVECQDVKQEGTTLCPRKGKASRLKLEQ